VSFTYWRGRKSLEVDILAEVRLQLIPFEVKYSRSEVLESDLKGLRLREYPPDLRLRGGDNPRWKRRSSRSRHRSLVTGFRARKEDRDRD
jgi:hypothetical protein